MDIKQAREKLFDVIKTLEVKARDTRRANPGRRQDADQQQNIISDLRAVYQALPRTTNG